MQITTILKKIGLSEKETSVYTSLLELGAQPVRVIAEKSGVNRGTCYDILKSLQTQGLVLSYDRNKHQYFEVEGPEKLMETLQTKTTELAAVTKEIGDNLPEIKSLFEKKGGRSVVKMYEGLKGIKEILNDVLDSVEKTKDRIYYVYSASTVREDVSQAYPDFSKNRIKRGIQVKTIALGEGGNTVGLDERRWLTSQDEIPNATYALLYAGKVAHISLSEAKEPVGVIIQNNSVYETQRMVFQYVWNTLSRA